MEKKEDGVFVSNVFLSSMENELVEHCKICRLVVYNEDVDYCYSCKLRDVIDDLRFIVSFAGEDNE